MSNLLVVSAKRELPLLTALFCASSVFGGSETIQIDASKIGPRLNSRMHGIFLEEINFGVDGAPEARITVLKSEHGSDNNSLENPAKVVPVTTTINVAGSSFSHEFPAYSFTILRVESPAGKSARTSAER